MSPEELAREKIDKLLTNCGWTIQNRSTIRKDWSSSDKTSSEGEARRVSAGSANQFQQFVTPDDGRKFTELYNVQHLQSAQLDRVSRVCTSTIQRLYCMLRPFFFWLISARRRVRSREETGRASPG